MDRCQVIGTAGTAARAHNVFHIDAFCHPLCRFLSGCITQVVAERDKRLVAVAAVQVNIGVCFFYKHLEQHMGKPVGLTALAVAGEDPVQILPVLIDAGHGSVFKAGAIGKRQNDDVAVQVCHVQLVGQLNCCLDPHILGIVDPGGDQHGRPGLFTAQQDMRDMQLRTFHMNMVFDGFSGHELMSGDHFYAHSKLLAPGFFIPYHRRCTSHKPPGGIFEIFFENDSLQRACKQAEPLAVQKHSIIPSSWAAPCAVLAGRTNNVPGTICSG